MPGIRNHARERAAWALTAREKQRRHAIYAAPSDRALIGPDAILGYLDHLGIRRLNGKQLSWRIVRRWRLEHDCPIIPGNHHRHGGRPALATTAQLSGWITSRFHVGELFSVAPTRSLVDQGSFPASVHEATQ